MGRCKYGKSLEIQQYILDKVLKKEISDTLFFVEHPHVLKMSRGAKEENIFIDKDSLAKKGIDIFYINRVRCHISWVVVILIPDNSFNSERYTNINQDEMKDKSIINNNIYKIDILIYNS